MSWGFFNKIKKGIRKFIKWIKTNFTLNDEGKIVLIKDVVQKEPTLLDKIYAGLRKLKVPSFKDFSTKYLDSNLRSFYPSYIHFGVNGEIYDSGNLISLEKLYSTMLRMIFLKEFDSLSFPAHNNFDNHYKDKEIIPLYPKIITIDENGKIFNQNRMISPLAAYTYLIENIIDIIKNNY